MVYEDSFVGQSREGGLPHSAFELYPLVLSSCRAGDAQKAKRAIGLFLDLPARDVHAARASHALAAYISMVLGRGQMSEQVFDSVVSMAKDASAKFGPEMLQGPAGVPFAQLYCARAKALLSAGEEEGAKDALRKARARFWAAVGKRQMDRTGKVAYSELRRLCAQAGLDPETESYND